MHICIGNAYSLCGTQKSVVKLFWIVSMVLYTAGPAVVSFQDPAKMINIKKQVAHYAWIIITLASWTLHFPTLYLVYFSTDSFLVHSQKKYEMCQKTFNLPQLVRLYTPKYGRFIIRLIHFKVYMRQPSIQVSCGLHSFKHSLCGISDSDLIAMHACKHCRKS